MEKSKKYWKEERDELLRIKNQLVSDFSLAIKDL